MTDPDTLTLALIHDRGWHVSAGCGACGSVRAPDLGPIARAAGDASLRDLWRSQRLRCAVCGFALASLTIYGPPPSVGPRPVVCRLT